MKLPEAIFTTIDWNSLPADSHPGESGTAIWRTFNLGNIRIRLVEYSPGYVADHWCDRGHILFLIKGELTSELRDGRKYVLTAETGYVVSDYGDAAHRSSTVTGAKLFIVD